MVLITKAQFSSTPPQREQHVWKHLSVWVVPLGILTIWQLLSSLGLVSTRILPSPVSVVSAAWDMLLSGDLLRDVGVSTRRAVIGLFIGGSIGLVLGFLNGFSSSPSACSTVPCKWSGRYLT